MKEHHILDKQITVKKFYKSAIFGKDFSKNSVSQNKKKCPTLHWFTDSSTVSSKGQSKSKWSKMALFGVEVPFAIKERWKKKKNSGNDQMYI